MKRTRPHRLGVLVCLLAAVALSACENAKPKVKTPARLLYYQAQALADQKLYSEAATKFQEVADQNQGTLLGSFAYLKLGELRVAQEDWDKAETNYRLFLTANQNSHLTPYVLYRLVQVNHEASYTGIFFRAREIDRDMQPNRQIIQEYKRFFFLYPHSVFLPDVRRYALDARETLAEHERLVGDFYYNRGHYNAAVGRYRYLLRNYPDYPHTDRVLERLINAYRRNQQPELAAEMDRIYKERFGDRVRTLPPDAPEGDAGSVSSAQR